MSWNPFKKAFSSRKPKKEDEDFEYEVQRLRIMQGVCKRLYKGIRQSSEIELALVKLNNKTSYDLKTNAASKIEPLRFLIEAFVSSADDLQMCTRDLYSTLDTAFYDPMRRFRDVFKHLEFHVKQREARQQEVEKQQAKLDKRTQSSSTPQTKIDYTKRKLTSKKNDYERIHEKLMTEMPKLYEGRVSFFKPCVIAMLQSQYLYHRQCAVKLKKTLSTFEKRSSSSNRTVEDCFNDIRKLSIVGEPS